MSQVIPRCVLCALLAVPRFVAGCPCGSDHVVCRRCAAEHRLVDTARLREPGLRLRACPDTVRVARAVMGRAEDGAMVNFSEEPACPGCGKTAWLSVVGEDYCALCGTSYPAEAPE